MDREDVVVGLFILGLAAGSAAALIGVVVLVAAW